MEGQLYNIDPEKFYLCLPNSCSDYFPAFLLMVYVESSNLGGTYCP